MIPSLVENISNSIRLQDIIVNNMLQNGTWTERNE